MVRPSRNYKNNTNAKKEALLLRAPARCIKCKIESVYKKLVKKEPKKTFKATYDVYNEENVKRT